MAIRNIVKEPEECLHKPCRPVTEFNERLWMLLDDMRDTLIQSGGVGLAAPQVGVLRRIFVMDVGDGMVEVINPELVKKKGTQEEIEGCLSCPDQWGITKRPAYVQFKAQDRHGNTFYIDGEDLKARCLCHENDHLDGILFKDRVIRMLDPSELE